MIDFTSIIILILVMILSALPLHISVKIMGGKTNILKTILVMLITAIISAIITIILPFGTLIAFIILIWIYHEIFRLKWIKAFLVWILQIVFIFILFLILSLFGLSLAIFTLSPF